jgi:uncharacterized repeat protein (TIGR01451 family)
VTCNLGSMSNGATATVTIVVAPTATGTISNTASVLSNENDPNTANNSATAMTTVNPSSADLSVTKADSPDPVAGGANLTYTITVRNNGPSPTTGVILTDTLPSGLTYVSATASQGSCSQASGTVTCNLGSMSNGATATVTIVVTPAAAGIITNTVSVSSSVPDPNTANNSATATTTINTPADLPRLINISTRAHVLTGNNVMIGGFYIDGNSSKTILLRARGPFMSGAPFNISGTLSDPMIQLYAGSTVIAQNDNWQTTDPLCASPAVSCGNASQIMATGLDPCQPNPGQTSAPPGCDQESAILVTLPPGGYTAIVSGVGGTTGLGLVEAFEVNATTSRLVNISTRAHVETVNNVEIGGFFIGGTNPRKLLLRARGPAMSGAPFNVPGTLPNPIMQLYAGSTVIAQNDNWQTTDPLCASPAVSCGNASQITATGLDPCQPNPGQTTAPPGCTQESAILVTLPPGGYTAIVSGVGGTAGVGLVEVFEVP